MIKILLDTSFILPFFGVKVDKVHEEIIEKIAVARDIEYLYPSLMIPELISVLAKKVGRKNTLFEVIREYLEDFLVSPDITLVDPKPEHLVEAIKIKALGHKDIFDCIAYATSKAEKSLFLTIDKELYKFLERNGFDISHIISQERFLQIAKKR